MNEEKSGAAIHIADLSVCYGANTALSGISFTVAGGEYLAVIGPNGGGKTTLLRAILGLVPFTGTILVEGKPPAKNAVPIGYVPQVHTLARRFPITVLETVLTGRMKRGIPAFFRFSKEDKMIAFALLEKVGLADSAKRPIAELSGGEFQKMLLARALAVEPRILLLDEPTASVDAVSRGRIYDLLGELSPSHTILLVTHDFYAVSSYVKKVACLNGSLLCFDEPQKVLPKYGEGCFH